MKVRDSRRCGAAVVVGIAIGLSLVAPSPARSEEEAARPAAAAPRHGEQRRAADGTLVVYNAVGQVWLAPERKDTYWVDGRFLTCTEGIWLASTSAKGPWDLVYSGEVPAAARERHPVPAKPTTVRLPSGTEAVFEPRIKAWKVAGKKGVFLSDGGFYRSQDGLWLTSAKEDGPWSPASPRRLPVPLRKAVPAPADGQAVTLPSGDVVKYEAATKVYVLDGKGDVVLYDGKFWTKKDESWLSSPSATSGFAEVPATEVPQAVRPKFKKAPLIGDKPKAARPPKADAKDKAAAGGNASAKTKAPPKKKPASAPKDGASAPE